MKSHQPPVNAPRAENEKLIELLHDTVIIIKLNRLNFERARVACPRGEKLAQLARRPSHHITAEADV